MAVKIRFRRTGKKHNPFYQLVAADERMPRDGRFLEKLGTYNPATKESALKREEIEKWLNNGAIPTDTVARLLLKEKIELSEKITTKLNEKHANLLERSKKEPTKEAASTD